jgi:hypothetical protein
MATTTNYGWTTPDDTALVKDGASAIRTLGSSVDTTTKNLNPETTLGDIAYRSSTSNVNTRLGIGTAGQILSVSGGVPAWTTAASAAPTSASANVTTSQSISSSTYGDLATAGPAVTLTTGTKALVIIGTNIVPAAGWWADMSYAVSGATTIAANAQWRVRVFDGSGDQQSFASTQVSLTAGSNTFTAKYSDSSNGSGASFANRYIIVIDLGS